jgi:hypothetical protein
MTQNQTQSMMNQTMNLMNGDYKTPGKLLIWAMAIGQWMLIIFFGGIFLILFLYFILSLVVDYKKNAELTQNSIAIKEQAIEKEFNKLSNIAEFLELREKSTNDRQNILESLIKIVRLPINQQVDQVSLEQRIKALSVELTKCNLSKERYKDKLSKAIKYFEIPAISKEFKKVMEKLLVDEPPLERYTAYVSKEGEQWEALCLLCQDELNKAHDELAHSMPK